MPELPEVNTVRKGFDQAVLDLKIIEVEVYDDKILRNASGVEFESTLTGQTFTGSYRQGKYFFGDLDDGSAVLFHLGMTGDIIYYHDDADRPPHERFSIKFSSGLKLGYDDPRKFSDIRILENRQAYLEQIGLGPDALEIDAKSFREIFDGRKTTIKALLMNQKLIAGIGNLYADEICFQARLHPGSRAGALSDRHTDSLYLKMREILQTACDRDAYYKVYPDDWFWKWRTDKIEFLEEKGRICKSKIAGRTTYYIEDYQKLIV